MKGKKNIRKYVPNRFVLVLLCISFVMPLFSPAQRTIVQYLSGTDKDNTVNWDFYCTKGRNSGKWTKIPVPSNWEMQGFGNYTYYKDDNDPEQGLYRHPFKLPAEYRKDRILIVFEAAMTDAEVKVNGRLAGPIHQGGFYEFKYDITDLVQFDKENVLEVTVSRHSANYSVNQAERKADFWLFGGIFRPVYLAIVPETFIERVAIDAKANGDFNVEVFSNAAAKTQTIEVFVQNSKGEKIAPPFAVAANETNVLSHHFNQITTWNPETPDLYTAVISIQEPGRLIHVIQQRFGFRTTELRPQDGFYVNGVKVIFKGVNHHCEWPESGRTLSRDIHMKDICLIKQMNMNAVRMSHYPPDKMFLDLCDSLGLFVLDELTGWQAAYDTVVGRKLVKELVVRDVNHPSVVIWDNGNEGGWNRALDNDYSKYDPQNRLVIHPWERFNGTNTKHYPDYKYMQDELTKTDVFFPTEFMHGLFDGGNAASLSDFWDLMLQHPNAAGGFLWSFHDEGIVRADRKDSIDVAGNQAPDGILGPHREKEGSFYAIKEIWSPIQIPLKVLPVNFDGKLTVKNCYLYTNLSECRFEWKLVTFPVAGNKIGFTILSKGTAKSISLAPDETGILNLNLDKAYNHADGLYLTAYNAQNEEIFTWSWAVCTSGMISEKANIPASKTEAVSIKEKDGLFVLTCDRITYTFSKKSGFLLKVYNGEKTISLSDGPALAGIPMQLLQFKTISQGDSFIVEPVYKMPDSITDVSFRWIFKKGQLPRLNYTYKVLRRTPFAGITFHYPEERVTGMQWLGRGPYRVWKNRLQGLKLAVWQKDYNNTVTGQSWNYPEFKGWHAQTYWATIQNNEADFTIYTNNENMYLQILQPAKPQAATNDFTDPAMPGNNIGFFTAISAIGTKFQDAQLMGPQGQLHAAMDQVLSGTLLFDFATKEKISKK